MMQGYYDNDINRRQFVSHLIKFDKSQLHEITAGALVGLTVDEISIYARPEFSNSVMKMIRYAIIEKMDIEKIKIFADPRFIAPQIILIKAGFDKGLTIEEVLSYANPEYTHSQMQNMLDKIVEKKTR